MSKGTRTRWRKLGYLSRFQRVDATEVGGAVLQSRLLVIRIQKEFQSLWMWRCKEIDEQRRPMSNLLTPPGLVPRKLYAHPPQGARVASAQSDPMPAFPGAWIKTKQGKRPL